MFSSGQWVFAITFALIFIAILFLAYKKDRKLHQKNYKGVVWVGIIFASFIIILFIIKYLLND